MLPGIFFAVADFLRRFHTKTIAEFTQACYHNHIYTEMGRML